MADNKTTPVATAEDSSALKEINDELAVQNTLLAQKEALVNSLRAAGNTRAADQLDKENRALQETLKLHASLKEKYSSNGAASAGLAAEHKRLESNIASAGRAMSASLGTMKGALQSAKEAAKDFGTLFGAGSVLAGATFAKEFVGNTNTIVGKFFQLQDENLAFNKGILQSGMSFGSTFRQAGATIGQFRERYAESLTLIKATPEEMKKVNDAFKNTVPVEKQIESVTNLSSAHGKIKSTLTMTNAALLAGAATGTDVATVSEWMGKAYLEMGNSIDGVGDAMSESIAAMGKISWAAKGSGLSFEKTGQAIMSGANSLKMWGGTISSVAPLFKTFSDAMTSSGWGRKGLTPELFQSWVDGISKMSFGTRALFGMQTPGMAGKGALGAGLEMEAAMEDKTGEGMKKVSESIMASLKQFGGGKILTREEAREDPAQQKNFMVQRQLLMQQMGMDQATANKTLNMLSEMDKNGVSSGEGSEDALGELLASGEKTQESTQSVVQQTHNEAQKARLQSGKDIVAAVGKLGGKLDLGNAFDKVVKAISVVTAKGTPGMADLQKALQDFQGAMKARRRPPQQAPIARTELTKEQKQQRYAAGAQRWMRQDQRRLAEHGILVNTPDVTRARARPQKPTKPAKPVDHYAPQEAAIPAAAPVIAPEPEMAAPTTTVAPTLAAAPAFNLNEYLETTTAGHEDVMMNNEARRRLMEFQKRGGTGKTEEDFKKELMEKAKAEKERAAAAPAAPTEMAPTAQTTQTPAAPPQSNLEKIFAKAEAGHEDAMMNNEARRRLIAFQKGGGTGKTMDDFKKQLESEAKAKKEATRTAATPTAEPGAELARTAIERAPVTAMPPPAAEGEKATKAARRVAGGGGEAEATPATKIKKELPIEIKLEAKIKGSTITIDVEPAIAKHVREIHVGSGSKTH